MKSSFSFLFILCFPLEGVKGNGLYPPGLSVTSPCEVQGQVKGQGSENYTL